MAGVQSASEKDVLIAILGEIRILNQQIAEQGGQAKIDELDRLRADQALLFPLLNTALQPAGG